MTNALFLPLALLALSPFPGTVPSPPSGTTPTATSLRADELEEAERSLELNPSDPAALLAVARLAREQDDLDKTLWYSILALEAAGDDKGHKDVVKAASALAAELAPEGASFDGLLEAHAKDLLALAKTCEKRKYYANAVDLLFRCEGTRYEKPAREKLDKLFSNAKAVDALIESGIEIPTRPATRRDPRWIAKEDAKHATWDKRYELEGKYYKVETNTGFEMANTLLSALEQMNSFFRKRFGYKARGGSMRTCVVQVYGSRAEFDQYEDVGPTVGGYFSPSENRVVTYLDADPADLWETLFHECAHQFKHAMSTNLVPAWWNEGLACYFEGAELSPSGSVTFNAVAAHRLRSLLPRIDGGNPSLEDVISYFSPGSYDGSMYAFGWGLVYFMMNYENGESERVFAPLFQDYFEAYRKGGGAHDVLQRFVDVVVKPAGVEGVEDFGSFKRLWRDWIVDLGDIYFGPAEKADVLLERAAKQVADGKAEHAVETLYWAAHKRPGDPGIRSKLAAALLATEQEDGAVFQLRKAIELVRGLEEGEAIPGFSGDSADDVIGSLLGRIEEIDKHVAKGIAEGEGSLVAGAADAASAYADAGYPRAALHYLQTTEAVLGGEATIAARAASLSKEHGVDVRRWRRLDVAEGLEAWSSSDDWSAGDAAVSVATNSLDLAFYREGAPERYSFEASLEPGKASGESLPVVGLLFGSNLKSGNKLFAVLPAMGSIGLIEFDDDGIPKISDRFKARVKPDAKALLLRVDVEPGRATFYLDGDKVGDKEYGPEDLLGRVGLFAQDFEATFRDIRILH